MSAYNGATSSKPYVLRVRTESITPPGACPAYAGSGGTVGTLNLNGLPNTLETLILVNQKRLGDRYGQATVDATVMASLASWLPVLG